MKIEKTKIEGPLIIEPNVFRDERGYFFESFNLKAIREAGISDNFVQDNQSCSQKNVVRGLHFQRPPFAQAKLVRVIKGSVVDFAVDIRKNSPTYGHYVSVFLSAENFRQFYIPIGFAHGFTALEDDTIFAYKCSNFYNKESEGSIIYNDPTVNIDWGTDAPIVSAKDLLAKPLKELNSPF